VIHILELQTFGLGEEEIDHRNLDHISLVH
jgi:hypothetical protein